MKPSILCIALAASLSAASIDSPTGSRTTPPTLNVINPVGIPRGATTEITIEGLNLARASAVYFSQPGVKGRILRVKELPDLPEVRLGSNGTASSVDLGPLPPRNQVTLDVDVSPDAEIGPVSLRLLTPLGTSPEGRLLIEPFYGEAPSKEPDDTVENAVETYLPAILTGVIAKPGDVDLFKIQVQPGEELTFYNTALLAGSTLQPVVSILDADQKLVREYGADAGMDAAMFACKFEKGGTYYVRVADYLESGKTSNFYRIIVGKFPLVARAYPLGAQRATSREFTLAGWNVPATAKVTAASTGEDENIMLLRPAHAFNQIRLAVGDEPEIESAQTNTSIATAQPVSTPVTINGVIARGGKPQYFRFHARKGEKLIIDVNAQRLGSRLDSVVDILDASGAPVERATLRSVLETSNTLADRDSASRGLRLLSWTGMNVGDYLMAGGEIIRIAKLPEGPDEDVLFESFNGQRLAFFDTTNEAQAVDKPVYKVQIYPPGSRFAPNGLPVVHPNYRAAAGRIRCAHRRRNHRSPRRPSRHQGRHCRRPVLNHAAAQRRSQRKTRAGRRLQRERHRPLRRRRHRALRQPRRPPATHRAHAASRYRRHRRNQARRSRGRQEGAARRPHRTTQRIRRTRSHRGSQPASPRPRGRCRIERRPHQ